MPTTTDTATGIQRLLDRLPKLPDRFAPPVERLARYTELVRDWNRRINLVSRRDTDRLVSYHLADSLVALRYLPDSGKVADIGSGAGLPGIPLALCRPDLQFVLVESSYKKAVFLNNAIAELGIENARVAAERAERLAPLECALVLSRQTGPIEYTLQWCARHCHAAGIVVLYKTPATAREISRHRRLLTRNGVAFLRSELVVLPQVDIPRQFVLLRRL